MSVAKYKLITYPAINNFFRDANLIGIISSQKEYQLCWQINRLLRFNFKMNNEVEVVLHKKDKRCFFQVYEYEEPMRFTRHYLYSNHYKGEFLVPELKHIDFLWLLKGEYYSEKEVKWLMEGIRKINNIQLITMINPEELKSRENLIL